MSIGYLFSRIKSTQTSRHFLVPSVRRKLVSVILILSMLILPNASFAYTQISSFASTSVTAGLGSLNYLPSLLKWLLVVPGRNNPSLYIIKG
jgi:hypothetical protein